MRAKLVATCLVLALIGTVVGGAMAAHAAETPAAIALGESPGPLRLFFSGQLGRLLTLRSELNLSGEQKQQIKQIIRSHRVEIATALKPVVEKHRALRDAVLADSGNEQAIRSAAGNLGTSIGDAAVIAAKVKGEVAKVLTPEQRATVAAFRTDSGKALDRFLDTMSK